MPYVLGWASCNPKAWLFIFMQALYAVSGKPNERVVESGLQVLRGHSGYEHIYTLLGVRLDTMFWADDFGGMLFERLPIADLLVIACTRDEFYYYRRPTVSQYAWLKKLLGEPKWYRYPWSRRLFDVDAFMV